MYTVNSYSWSMCACIQLAVTAEACVHVYSQQLQLEHVCMYTVNSYSWSMCACIQSTVTAGAVCMYTVSSYSWSMCACIQSTVAAGACVHVYSYLYRVGSQTSRLGTKVLAILQICQYLITFCLE